MSENRSVDVAEVALRTGAGGYLVKSDAASEPLPAARAVLEGRRSVSTSLWPVHRVVEMSASGDGRPEKLAVQDSLEQCYPDSQ